MVILSFLNVSQYFRYFTWYVFIKHLVLLYCYIKHKKRIGQVCTVTQSCLAQCGPLGSSSPGSPVPGVILARMLEWVAFSSSRDLPHTGNKPTSPRVSALADRFFTTGSLGKLYKRIELNQIELWGSSFDFIEHIIWFHFMSSVDFLNIILFNLIVEHL